MFIEFKENADISPLFPAHFPTLQQAIVWRNWELVPIERLAKVLRTSGDNILNLAREMGLRVPPMIGALWLSRGYITIIRANWHLLSYEQLLILLDWSAEKLAYTLQEDDFLWIKLGGLKPLAKLVYYEPLSIEEEYRTAEIRGIILENFPDIGDVSRVKPFDFLAEFQKPDKILSPRFDPAEPQEVFLNERWTVIYPQNTEHAQTFAKRFIADHEAAWGLKLAISTERTNQSAVALNIKPDSSLLSESHTIEITANRIEITSVDEVGLLRGLQWLNASMDQRGKPCLKPETVKRHTRFDLRFIYSYFAVYGDPLLEPGVDPYPDELLLRLSRQGVNGVWLQAVLYNLIPWEEAPELSTNWEKRIEGLKNLTERAADYGIGIYLYYNEPRAMPLSFFAKHPEWKGHTSDNYAALCTSQKAIQDYIKNSTARLFKEVPRLAGLFTITMSENLTNCYSRAFQGKTNCPLCATRTAQEVAAEVNRLIAEGAHSINPSARILCWTWGWAEFFGWDQKMVREAIEMLPGKVSVMCTSEEDIPTNIAGIKGNVADYSISVVGPGEKSADSWKTAANKGISTVAKVQFNNSWECSAVPYLPTLDLVEQHLNRLIDSGVTGLMLGWTLGGFPSLNLELAKQYYWKQERDGLSDSGDLTATHFGTQVSPLIKEALGCFSNAFQEFPFHIAVLYNAPQNRGPANLLYEIPTNFKATMVGIPYDDLESWRGIYPEDVFENQFAKMSDGWKQGLELLKRAKKEISPPKQRAFDDLSSVAWGAYYHFRSALLQISFVRLRDRLHQSDDIQERTEISARLMDVIEEEIQIAKSHYHVVRKDSRIGYEASNHYFYTLQDLREKVVNCEYIRKSLKIVKSN